jgi:hypothetical protein
MFFFINQEIPHHNSPPLEEPDNFLDIRKGSWVLTAVKVLEYPLAEYTPLSHGGQTLSLKGPRG